MIRSKVTRDTSVTVHQCLGYTLTRMLSVGHQLPTTMSVMISHALLAASTLTTAKLMCLAPLRQVAQESLYVCFLSQAVS